MSTAPDNTEATAKSPLDCLREAVEQRVGHAIRTPKDFDYLHAQLFDEVHQMVSVSTLKRIWGYVHAGSSPRPSTLTPLAQYVGYDSWDDFVLAHADAASENTTEPEPQPVGHHRRWLPTAISIVLLLLALAGWFITRNSHHDTTLLSHPSGQRVLHAGLDAFVSIDDYLSLLGMQPSDTAYFQLVPGTDLVYAWGPEYGNPVWHNEGDSSLLMPTITEYWTPRPEDEDYQSEQYVRLANEKLYYERLDRDELRITFMRDIRDSLYLFLGIYAMDRELSTREKFVWRRVADSLDLGYLTQLGELRETRKQ